MQSVTGQIKDPKVKQLFVVYANGWKTYASGTLATQKKCSDPKLKWTPAQCMSADDKVVDTFRDVSTVFKTKMRAIG